MKAKNKQFKKKFKKKNLSQIQESSNLQKRKRNLATKRNMYLKNRKRAMEVVKKASKGSIKDESLSEVKGKIEDLKKIDKTINKLNSIDDQLISIEEELERIVKQKSNKKIKGGADKSQDSSRKILFVKESDESSSDKGKMLGKFNSNFPQKTFRSTLEALKDTETEWRLQTPTLLPQLVTVQERG